MRHLIKKFTHQILNNQKMLEEGLSLKLTLKCFLSRKKVIFTSNITSFFLNETYIDMMKRNFFRLKGK